MTDFLEPSLLNLVGKRCKFETRDGAIRTEKVVSVECIQLEINGVELDLPVTILFDEMGYDGIELRIAKRIETL